MGNLTIMSHEQYSNAPLAFAAVEVRFPGEGGAGLTPFAQRAFRDELGDQWVIEQMAQREMSINLMSGESASQSIRTQNMPRFVVRDRTSAIMVTPNSVSVETTRYLGWSDFRGTVDAALRATSKLVGPEGISRLGMRYVNEVRAPGAGIKVQDWATWLSPEVLAPGIDFMVKAGYPPVNWTGAAQYAVGQDMQIVARYGPRPSYVVNPVGPLRRIDPPQDGPLFVLDFDGFWEPPNIPHFDVDDLLTKCGWLRGPIWALFERIVTQRLVDEVFKKEDR